MYVLIDAVSYLLMDMSYEPDISKAMDTEL
jgi:hypothetical protein